jgi:hypothetical protein
MKMIEGSGKERGKGEQNGAISEAQRTKQLENEVTNHGRKSWAAKRFKQPNFLRSCKPTMFQ